jgi:hypothetical protein
MTKNTTPTHKARMMRARVSARMVRACESYIIGTNTMTAINTIAAFTIYAQGATVSQCEAFKAAHKNQDLIKIAAMHMAAKRANILGTVNSWFTVSRGIVDALCDGQRSVLTGFEFTQKKTSSAFQRLAEMGVISTAGAVLVGKDKKVKPSDKGTLMALVPAFMARLWSECAALDAAAREATKAAKPVAKPAADLPDAPDMVQTPSPAQSPIEALIALLQAGMVSANDVARIRAALPALEVVEEVAPILSLGYTPAPKVRKARKPRATA